MCSTRCDDYTRSVTRHASPPAPIILLSNSRSRLWALPTVMPFRARNPYYLRISDKHVLSLYVRS
jgi:hypothetical protein